MNKNIQKLIILTMILFSIYLSIQLLDELIVIIKVLFKILFPIIFGFAIAFLLNPLKQRLIRKKIPNCLATFFLVIVFIGVILGITIIVIPNLIEEMTEFINKMPFYVEKVEKMYNKYLSKIKIKESFDDGITEIMNKILIKTVSFLQTIISYSFNFVIGFFLSFYLLYDFEKIVNFIKNKTDNLRYLNWRIFLKELNESMYSYFKGIIQSNVILCLLAIVCFAVVKLDHFVAISLILAITNIIPYLGPYIGGSFAIIVALNSSTKLVLYVFFIIIILQFIDNYIISPKIQSKNNEIKPIIVIVSIVIMGSIFGIFGMIFAVPIVLLMRTFYFNFIKNK